MWKGCKGKLRGEIRGSPSPGRLACGGSNSGFQQGPGGSRCGRRQAAHRVRLRRREGGPRVEESLVLFPVRVSVKGGGCSHTTGCAFCKGHSGKGERIAEGQSWTLGGHWGKIMVMVQSKGISLNQDGGKKWIISKTIYNMCNGKRFESIVHINETATNQIVTVSMAKGWRQCLAIEE